jgi:hypothetical protein
LTYPWSCLPGWRHSHGDSRDQSQRRGTRGTHLRKSSQTVCRLRRAQPSRAPPTELFVLYNIIVSSKMEVYYFSCTRSFDSFLYQLRLGLRPDWCGTALRMTGGNRATTWGCPYVLRSVGMTSGGSGEGGSRTAPTLGVRDWWGKPPLGTRIGGASRHPTGLLVARNPKS